VGDLPTLADHPRAIGILVFDEVVIEDLAVAFGVADLAPAHALSTYGMLAFDPIANVDVMDVLLDNVIA
jgi:hypothetical protein